MIMRKSQMQLKNYCFETIFLGVKKYKWKKKKGTYDDISQV